MKSKTPFLTEAIDFAIPIAHLSYLVKRYIRLSR